MDCAICCDEITAATGRSVMSCGHEFHMACLVRWLQKPDGTGNCPCCRAEPSIQERLIAAPVDSDDEEEDEDEEETTNVTPLMDAVLHGKLTQVRQMIVDGVDLEARDSDGDTALNYAVLNGEDECAIALVAAGADILSLGRLTDDENTSLDNTLIAAALYNSVPLASVALERGANPNYAHPISGVTVLMEAVRPDTIAMVDLLIAKGANVFAVDTDGWNVFMWFAEECNDIDIMASLLTAAGPLMRPMVATAKAAKKIQALWRGYYVRRTFAEALDLLSLSLSLSCSA